MAPDAEALRAILKQYIGPAYDRALRNTGDPAAAKEATRRVMELLKRACMDGVEPTKALVLRITDDCCNEKAFFNRQVEVERQKLQAGEPGAEAGMQAPAEGETKPVLRVLQAKEAALEKAQKPRAEKKPKPQAIRQEAPAAKKARPEEAAPAQGKAGGAQRGTKPRARANLEEPEVPDFVLAPSQRKRETKDQASAGTVLLVMFLSLVIVLSVICLVLALAGSGRLPDAGGVLERISTWFNTHIFPMF